MAFRVLNDVEVEKLSDEQKLQYEKELETFNRRSKYLDRMDEISELQISPVTPMPLSLKEIKEFEVQEKGIGRYLIQEFESVEKIEIPYKKNEWGNFSCKNRLPQLNELEVTYKNFEKIEPRISQTPLIKNFDFYYNEIDKAFGKNIEIKKQEEFKQSYEIPAINVFSCDKHFFSEFMPLTECEKTSLGLQELYKTLVFSKHSNPISFLREKVNVGTIETPTVDIISIGAIEQRKISLANVEIDSPDMTSFDVCIERKPSMQFSMKKMDKVCVDCREVVMPVTSVEDMPNVEYFEVNTIKPEKVKCQQIRFDEITKPKIVNAKVDKNRSEKIRLDKITKPELQIKKMKPTIAKKREKNEIIVPIVNNKKIEIKNKKIGKINNIRVSI